MPVDVPEPIAAYGWHNLHSKSHCLRIAFGYKMGVGKDTAVDHLIRAFGGVQHTFSKPLYDILHYAQFVCGFRHEKDRKFLQYIGTEWARDIDPDVWVKLLLQNTAHATHNVFISDLRFPNELNALKKNGWTTVKIIRSSVDTNRQGSGSCTHASETVLDAIPDSEWDFVLDNSSTLSSFYAQLDAMYAALAQPTV